MQKKCNTIHVCAFLGMQSLRIKVNPDVERGLYSIISGWRTCLGQLLKTNKQTNKNTLIEYQKKKRKKERKKADPSTWFFWSVRKGQTNIFFFFFFFFFL